MGHGARVLVIDDDTFLRMLVSIELPELELLEASRLEDGYRVIVEERPDLVLLDQRLPDGDGLDLVRRLRTQSDLVSLPVIVISAGYDPTRHLDVLRAGADEYVPKPVVADDLRARIERILGVAPDDRRWRRAALVAQLEKDGGTATAATEGGDRPGLGRFFRRRR